MKAVRFHQHGGPEVLRYEDAPDPAPAPGRAIVRVRACALNHLDLWERRGLGRVALPLPHISGSDAAGEIVDAGGGELPSGTRVLLQPGLRCGRCRYCTQGRPHICARRTVLGIHRDGALAEYVAVPETNLVALPPGVSFEEAAIVESASTPYHALTARAPVAPGDPVAVIGVGGLGLHGVQVARILGATPIVAVDVSEPALERALAAGATHAVDARVQDPGAVVRALTDDEGVAVALECVGLPETCRWAVESIRAGGIAAIVGIGPAPLELIPTTVFARSEREVRGVYSYDLDEIRAVMQLIADGALDARLAISETYPLEDVNHGLESFRTKSRAPVRVLITP